MNRLFIDYGDFQISVDLCFVCKLTLAQWRKIVRLAAKYNPEQLRSVADYFRDQVQSYSYLLDSEKEKLAIAEISFRLNRGKKKDVTEHKREVKTLEKALSEWEKRFEVVKRTSAREAA